MTMYDSWRTALREPENRAGQPYAVHHAAGLVAYAINTTGHDGGNPWGWAKNAAQAYRDPPSPYGLPALAGHLAATLIRAQARHHGPAGADEHLDQLLCRATEASFPICTAPDPLEDSEAGFDWTPRFTAGRALRQHLQARGYGTDATGRDMRELARFATAPWTPTFAIVAAPLFRAGIGIARRHRDLVAPALGTVFLRTCTPASEATAAELARITRHGR